MHRIHLKICGRVQGVAFRAYAQREGRKLGLNGWVRNLADGTVELIAEGEREDLEKLETWCRSGPPSASVDHVETQWLDFVGDLSPFNIRYG